MKFSFIFQLLSIIFFAEISYQFDYNNQGSDWSEGQCKSGSSQSPIEIEEGVSVCSDSAQLYFIPEDVDILTKSIFDNQIQLSGEFSSAYSNDVDGVVAGYTAYEINIKSPAEHIIDGKKYDVEVQIMHKVKDDFESTQKRGIAGISLLFQKGSSSNSFFDNIKLSNFPSDEYSFNLQSALKTAEFNSTSEFYTYKGSLTQPSCTENVNWYIYIDPLNITDTQYSSINNQLAGNEAFAGGNGNDRTVQDLNGRDIQKGNSNCESQFIYFFTFFVIYTFLNFFVFKML